MKRLKDSTIFIIGLGQIGGSIGLDLIDKNTVYNVIGFDKDKRNMLAAKKLKAIDCGVTVIKDGLKRADIIIIATPIRTIPKLLASVYPRAGRHQIILDVGSTKSKILEIVSNTKSEATFIGGHPIAGTEKEGIRGAQKNLFKKAPFILSPVIGTSREKVNRIKSLIRRLGARPIMMAPSEHDRLIALTSHLPYALSLALMNIATNEIKKTGEFRNLIGGSFRSATRVAMSSPILTIDMFKTNKKEIVRAIDNMIKELNFLKKTMNYNSETRLKSIITKAGKKRREWPDG
jgi:prephenate dehydrogenase